jgi:hypothetical protein
MVFTPVKSASVLWALGGPQVRAAVEDAHHEAVRSALAWVETHAAYTRAGHAGAAQTDAPGLVAAAFEHRDSRTGDPDLHTHVAVANKVRGVDGKWRALDARNLYAVGVAASERYNTRFEDALARRLGVVFAERPGGAAGKRPVREILGVPPALIRHFSRRRAAIEDRLTELRADYRATHRREPSRAGSCWLPARPSLDKSEAAHGERLFEQVVERRHELPDVRRGVVCVEGVTIDPPLEDRQARRVGWVLEKRVLEASGLPSAERGQPDEPTAQLRLPPALRVKLRDEYDDSRRCHAPCPARVAMCSATLQAFAMMVSVGLAPVAVGNGLPSTT